MSETYTFTGREVQELVSGCHLLQVRIKNAMDRVRGVGEEADEKRDAIRAWQAVVDALVEKFMASGK